VKEPHAAGRWYPAEPARLAATVQSLLGVGGAPRPGVVGILAPHGPWAQAGAVAARAFAAAGACQRALVLAPSHFADFAGAAVLPYAGYRTPLGLVALDEPACAAVARAPMVRANPALFMREHAVEALLPFLQSTAPGATVVPLLVGRLGAGEAEALATHLRAIVEPGTLLVASSDLVHYGRRFGFLPVPPDDPATVAAAVGRLDETALERLVARDPNGFAAFVAESGATICGRDALDVWLRALPADARGERLAYTTSLAETGAHEQTTSYAAVAFTSAVP
jgi:AmmeMemoRadiSam system protein B